MKRVAALVAVASMLAGCSPIPPASRLAGELDEAGWQELSAAVEEAAERAGPAGAELGPLLAASREIGNFNVAQAADGSGGLIHQAARLGDAELLRELIVLEAIPAGRTTGDGLTALHMAAQVGCVECLEVLLGADVAVDLLARDGQRAIEMAAAAGQDAAVEALLKAGAAELAEPVSLSAEETIAE